ncbi:MAG: hypothetical protein ACLTEE_17975 [Anaerobutyricum hallii]
MYYKFNEKVLFRTDSKTQMEYLKQCQWNDYRNQMGETETRHGRCGGEAMLCLQWQHRTAGDGDAAYLKVNPNRMKPKNRTAGRKNRAGHRAARREQQNRTETRRERGRGDETGQGECE